MTTTERRLNPGWLHGISDFMDREGRSAPRYLGLALFAFCLIAQTIGARMAERTSHHKATRCMDGSLYFVPAARSLWTSGTLKDVQGRFLTQHPPAFPLALAPALAAGDALGVSEKTASQMLNIVFASLAALGLFEWTRRILGWPWAVLATVGFGLHPAFVWLCRDAYNEPLFTALLLWGLCLFSRGVRKIRRLDVAAGMALLGLATLTRAVGLLTPVAAMAGYWIGGTRDWRAFCRLWLPGLLVYGLVLLPWTAIVSWHVGRLTPVTTSFVYSHVDGLISVSGNATSQRAKVYFAHHPRAGAEALRFHREALYSSPGSYLAMWARKVFDAWSATESGGGRKALLLLNGPLLFLAAAGVGFQWRRREAFGPDLVAAGLVLLYFWGMTVVAWSTLRYMVPVLWVPVVFSLMGLREILWIAGGRSVRGANIEYGPAMTETAKQPGVASSLETNPPIAPVARAEPLRTQGIPAAGERTTVELEPSRKKYASGLRVRNDLPSVYGFRNKAGRALWGVTWAFLFRPSPRPFHAWRRYLLRLFGAKLAPTARIASSVVVWAPWNLSMDDSAEIGPNVDCYSVAPIHLGTHATVSQYAYLCSGSRDIHHPRFPPTKEPITIEDQAWVCADAFVGPGVTVGQGAVVSARAVALSDIPPWTVCAGNPAQPIQKRIIYGTLEDPTEND